MNELECVECHSNYVVKNGVLASGGQRYRCGDCDEHFSVGGSKPRYTTSKKSEIVKEYLHDRSSARVVADKYTIALSTLVLRARKHKQSCYHCQH